MDAALLTAGLLAATGGLALAGAGGWAWRLRRRHARLRDRLHRTEAELAARTREGRVLLQSVQELVFRTDLDGRVAFLNSRWLAVVGPSAAQALGRPLEFLIPAPGNASLAALLDSGNPARIRRGRFQVTDASGQVRHFDLTVLPWMQGDRLAGFSGSAMDVTERVQIEQQLTAQLALSDLLQDISPLPMSLTDAQDRYLTVNHAWQNFRGLRREEVIGRDAIGLQADMQRELHRTQLARLREGRSHVRYEAKMEAADGSLRDVMVTRVAVPDGSGQGAGGVLTVLMDVTEFRDAERATREARDAAEEASRAKSEFVANISHELRTPLQSILGFSELGTLRAAEHPRLAAMFSDVHAAGQRMLALVNDLLDVSKIESAVGTFHLERTDVRQPVRSVVHELAPLLEAKRLHVELQLGALPLSAKVDPLRFQQVVRNVLANAIKFSPPRSSIDITGALTATGDVQVRIRDRGPGIPAQELEAIFEAFVQSSQTKDGSGGTGLGLAISRKIMEAHGGDISARNCPDGGSEFELYLPGRGFAETLPGT